MMPMGPDFGDDMMRNLREQLEKSGMGGDRMGDIMKRMEELMQSGPGGGGITPQRQMRRRFSNPGGNTVTSSTSDGLSLTITTDDKGGRTLSAADQTGKQMFHGPVNTKEDIEKVPAEIRKKFDELDRVQRQKIPPEREKKEKKTGASTPL